MIIFVQMTIAHFCNQRMFLLRGKLCQLVDNLLLFCTITTQETFEFIVYLIESSRVNVL